MFYLNDLFRYNVYKVAIEYECLKSISFYMPKGSHNQPGWYKMIKTIYYVIHFDLTPIVIVNVYKIFVTLISLYRLSFF